MNNYEFVGRSIHLLSVERLKIQFFIEMKGAWNKIYHP